MGELVQQVELFEVIKCMQKEKLELTDDLLVRMEELKKAKKDTLCEAIGEKTMEIDSLRMQLDREVMEKLKLRGRVRELKVSSCQMSMRPKT